jgi:antitoxin component YwqK of YwqJK toxin-antitoxin module
MTLVTCSDEKRNIKYNLDGTIKETWIFEKDTLTGKEITYWPNGKTKVVYSYIDGKLNGEYAGYFGNGLIARRSFFHDNVLRGSAYRFYPDNDGLIELGHIIPT